MRTRRFLGSLAASLVVVGSVAVAGAAPAGARTTPVITIKAGDPVSATFPGIPGNFSGNAAAIPTPSGCEDAAPFTLMCDTVPLDIVPPVIDEADDWTVFIEVTWRPEETNDNDVQSVQACDLDIYLWDDRQIARRDDADSETYTRYTASESATQPELVKTFAPALGRYNLTVVNFSGVNVDYTVKAWIEIGAFDRPFEVLAPTAKPKGAPLDDEGPPPEDLSDERAATPSSGPTLEDAAPSPIGEVAVLPDSDFLDFDSGSSFETQLQRRMPEATGFGDLGRRPPAGDVSPAVLVFWFLIAPLALGGAGFLFLIRRNRGMLTLGSS